MLHTFYLGLLLCVAGSYALYDSSSSVVELTPSNFDKLVTNSDDVWIVEFYAPWCGHCKNLVPEYKKAAKALKGIIKVGAVDADSHQALAKKYGVSGYPTLKIFTGSKHTPYQGQRTAEAFVDAGIKAAKDKAYENLGKKSGGGGSGDKHFKAFGHRIQWKKVQRSENKTENRTSKPQVDKLKFKTLQNLLFRAQNEENNNVDKQIKMPKYPLLQKPEPKHLMKQTNPPKHVLRQKTAPKHELRQKNTPKDAVTRRSSSKNSIRQKALSKQLMGQKIAPKRYIVHKNATSHLFIQKTMPKNSIQRKMVLKDRIRRETGPHHSLRPKNRHSPSIGQITLQHSLRQKTVPKHSMRQKSVPKHSMQKTIPKNALKTNSDKLDKLQATLFRRRFDEEIDLNVQK